MLLAFHIFTCDARIDQGVGSCAIHQGVRIPHSDHHLQQIGEDVQRLGYVCRVW